ncbi:hypothetical protein SOCE26_033240 [Sorangium cellulosum]|uniref:Nudix hydrolase domain-containing protein n=1 Tax=Sorangium cellulosum TaxID=56 RepID=A0A2L0ERH3_SORCE|nr:hypothetical protein [Sorangium cellulosum]AUX41899.1 hypothetical protein SOCE26_033240 [Sorangium cellulosum]
MKLVKSVAGWLLAHADPREPLGSSLISAISRLPIHLAADAVCLRKNADSGALEVLLTQRGASESDPGAWCCPGSVLSPGEQPEHVLHRLGVTISDFTFLGDYFSAAARGWMVSRVHQAKLAEVPATGAWWPVEQLPNNTVPKHREQVIPMAVKAFHAERAKLSRQASAPAM